MKTRAATIIILTGFVFGFIKFYLSFPTTDADTLQVIFSIASILFGFLAGFFISQLRTRYVQIRELQGMRNSDELNMIEYAEQFFKNKDFESDFKRKVETAEIVDNIIYWDEGHLEIP